MSDASLLLYTKPAQPGRVKTRLIGELSAQQAAALHAAFLRDVVEEMSGGRFELRLAWAVETGAAVPGWNRDDGGEVAGELQQGADLGERLARGLEAAARRHRFVAAVGSDHPTLHHGAVEQAFAHLRGGAEVVLGPADDGGYYLIAVAREALHRRLFEAVPWSTVEVLETTVERCRELGIEPVLLAPGWDVDTPEDLRRLERELAGDPKGEIHRCRHTRRLLASWGRLAVAGAGAGDRAVRNEQGETPCEC